MKIHVRELAGELHVREGDGRILFGPIVPWGVEAQVIDRGRLVVETFTRGAFDGIDPSTVPLTRQHPRDGSVLPIGVAVALRNEPDAQWGEFHVPPTPEGDAVLELARAKVPLSMSVGFTETPHGSQWLTRERVVRVRAGLDHVGIVRKGAYTGARVAGVRHAEGEGALTTPRLQVARWRY